MGAKCTQPNFMRLHVAGPNKLGLKGQLQTNYGILATMRPNQFEILVLAVRRSFAPELRQHILPKLIMGFWQPCNLPEPERKGAMCKGIHPGNILIPVCAFEFTDFGNHAAIEQEKKGIRCCDKACAVATFWQHLLCKCELLNKFLNSRIVATMQSN